MRGEGGKQEGREGEEAVSAKDRGVRERGAAQEAEEMTPDQPTLLQEKVDTRWGGGQ